MSNYVGISNRFRGTAYAILGVMALTPDSLLVRKVSNMPNFAVLFYRYLIFAMTMLVVLVFVEKHNIISQFKNLGKWGLITGLVLGCSNLFITMGFQLTAVANVLVIHASNPIWAALFSHIFLQESLPYRTMVAGLVCIAAIIMIFSGELSSGTAELPGLLSALASSLSFGSYFVLLRYTTCYLEQEINLLLCNILAGSFVVTVSLCTAPDLSDVEGIDVVYLFLMGIGVLCVAFTFLTWAPSYISAPEVALYTLLETILGPIWVWLGGYEAPPIYALYGGIAMIGALTTHSVLALQESEEESHVDIVDDTGSYGSENYMINGEKDINIELREIEAGPGGGDFGDKDQQQSETEMSTGLAASISDVS